MISLISPMLLIKIILRNIKDMQEVGKVKMEIQNNSFNMNNINIILNNHGNNNNPLTKILKTMGRILNNNSDETIYNS